MVELIEKRPDSCNWPCKMPHLREGINPCGHHRCDFRSGQRNMQRCAGSIHWPPPVQSRSASMKATKPTLIRRTPRAMRMWVARGVMSDAYCQTSSEHERENQNGPSQFFGEIIHAAFSGVSKNHVSSQGIPRSAATFRMASCLANGRESFFSKAE